MNEVVNLGIILQAVSYETFPPKWSFWYLIVAIIVVLVIGICNIKDGSAPRNLFTTLATGVGVLAVVMIWNRESYSGEMYNVLLDTSLGQIYHDVYWREIDAPKSGQAVYLIYDGTTLEMVASDKIKDVPNLKERGRLP